MKSIFLGCGLMLTLTLMGCGQGKARSKPTEDTKAAVSAYSAENLKPRIVRERSDRPEQPDSKQVVYQNVLVSGKNISFVEFIQMNLEKLHLLWDVGAFGEPIVQAFYKYETRNEQNRLDGGIERTAAQGGIEQGFWSIPLSEVLTKLNETSPAKKHYIEAELQFESGKVEVFRLQFNINTGLASLSPEMVLMPEVLDEDPVSFSHRVESAGWVFAKENYSNSTTQPLKVWIRAQARSVSQTAHVHYSWWEETPSGVPFEHHANYVSLAEMKFSHVVVVRGQKREILKIEDGQWASFDIKAKESFSLEWAASLQPAKRCNRQHYDLVVNGTWKTNQSKVTGMAFEAVTSRDIAVSEMNVQESEIDELSQSEVRSKVLLKEKEKKVLQVVGSVQRNRQESWVCQGLW